MEEPALVRHQFTAGKMIAPLMRVKMLNRGNNLFRPTTFFKEQHHEIHRIRNVAGIMHHQFCPAKT
jgi:hypothetical protein